MRSINISTVTVGTDPEGFLVKKDNNEFYPACGIIGGDKWSPKKIKDGGYAIQEDNVMVEFNVPYTTLDNPTKIHNDIQFVLDHIRGIVEPKGLEVKMVPSAYFNWEHLDTEQARTFGWTQPIV